MYRFIGSLFLILTALGGYTVSGGYLFVALINVVVFLLLALGVAHYVAPKYGREGLVYGMGGAFLLSVLWPIAAMPWLIEAEEAEAAEQGVVELQECPPDGCRMIVVPPEPERDQDWELYP